MVLGEARITDEGLDKLRARIGLYYRINQINEVASRDIIRHYAEGIGDYNPLWLDEGYASRTRYKSIIAPPTFLYGVFLCSGHNAGGLPGVHGFFSGADWRWSRVIRAGDAVAANYRPVDVVEKSSAFALRTVIVYGESLYRNQRDELIARCKGWTIRAERKAARERGKYRDIAGQQYSPEDLKAIQADLEREDRRGAMPRYWEEVEEEEELTPVVKGPLAIEDMIAYRCGASLEEAHGLRLRRIRRHPAWGFRDPKTGGIQTIGQVHEQDGMAGGAGIPSAYDLGPQRIGWLGQLLTNWMGDDASLRTLYAEIRRFNPFGNTMWCKGKVTRKYIEADDHLVDCEIWAENQKGEITAPGRATISLPSKSV
ncbi:MAG: MaoC family dehydratase N-terminal domain-containing protein [Chloroflexi bacterium]|nr:MaoC family dehydratase N-terminal domain-containing protein [Chloroflexota bacterium]